MPSKSISHLTAQDFGQAFDYFKEFLVQYEQLVNDLNVYPVPDSDTGTNSLVTLNSGLAQMTGQNVHDLANSLASGCAKSALGNSGVILSAYLSGLAQNVNDPVDLAQWQSALKNAAQFAQLSVLTPSQGTMLTIAQTVAAQEEETLAQQLIANSIAARIALTKTTQMLPELAAAGVVDSGAVVLTLLHDAFAKTVTTGRFSQLEIHNTHCNIKPEYFGPSNELMFDLALEIQDKETFISQIAKLGESISITSVTPEGNDYLQLRVHIHCDNPDLVVEIAKTFGQVSDLVLINLALQKS